MNARKCLKKVLRNPPHCVKTRRTRYSARPCASETLDYRHAERYYRACALRIQAGGDHSFQGFVERLPTLLACAGIAPGAYARLFRALSFVPSTFAFT